MSSGVTGRLCLPGQIASAKLRPSSRVRLASTDEVGIVIPYDSGQRSAVAIAIRITASSSTTARCLE
jgi:hypothetical protein